MADVQPLRAIHYDLDRVGSLDVVASPPYDVIDAEHRARLAAQSPSNVVVIDLPVGEDPYAHAAETMERWLDEGILVRDDDPALWALTQEYTGPDGVRRTRHGFLGRIRVEDYGPGRVRPHERTHPGPKEDRLRLTRATKANTSPIFALHDDPGRRAWKALEPHTAGEPWGAMRDDDGTEHRLWRVADPDAIAAVQDALGEAELLIADGHHRYETARVYAEEIGGQGDHRFVLACLVGLEDPGLTVFPTHRLLKDLRPDQYETLAQALRQDFEIAEVGRDELAPAASGRVTFGYIDAHFKRPFRLTLKDQAVADAALEGHAAPYRRLDTAVLEALILKGALEKTDEDIDHLEGLGYSKDAGEVLELVESGAWDCAFMMAPPPIEQVQAVAGAGETMPPKSTYFFPKVPTGLLFNPLA
jgi:uncharacterized protein (DUF1015 family)